MLEKGEKYIIYLHWQRETNAFTEIEDRLPSLVHRTLTNTHTYVHIDWVSAFKIRQ